MMASFGRPGHVARELLVNAGPEGVQHSVVQVILVAGRIFMGNRDLHRGFIEVI